MNNEYLVMIYNQDADEPITRHASLDAAKAYVRAYLADPDNDPAPTAELLARANADLARLDEWGTVQEISGEMAWGERIVFARVPYCQQGEDIDLPAPGGVK